MSSITARTGTEILRVRDVRGADSCAGGKRFQCVHSAIWKCAWPAHEEEGKKRLVAFPTTKQLSILGTFETFRKNRPNLMPDASARQSSIKLKQKPQEATSPSPVVFFSPSLPLGDLWSNRVG